LFAENVRLLYVGARIILKIVFVVVLLRHGLCSGLIWFMAVIEHGPWPYRWIISRDVPRLFSGAGVGSCWSGAQATLTAHGGRCKFFRASGRLVSKFCCDLVPEITRA
jgi:hypothetical protein